MLIYLTIKKPFTFFKMYVNLIETNTDIQLQMSHFNPLFNLFEKLLRE